jgi:SPASM domain peptide maturase of grasp-with-spasm system
MFIKLYETIIITKGITRSVICDTHTGKINFIPNDMLEFLDTIKNLAIADYFKKYPENEVTVLNEYIEFIIENDYGFICNSKTELHCFSKKPLVFENPFEITNCIIDFSSKSRFDIKKVFDEINALHIPFVQIRISQDCSKKQITHIIDCLKSFNDTSLNEMFILLPYDATVESFLKTNLAIEKYLSILFYKCEENKKCAKVFNNIQINYTKTIINIPNSCGIIKISNFIIQEDFYRESLKFNNCLNQKISIDQNGKIKNCPSMAKSYGNINDTSLMEAISKERFKNLWHIKKDDIAICKTCEFRHICTDCRAYLQNSEDIYSKPLKCGYDPKTNKWEDWSINPLSKKGIEDYGMQDIIRELND